MEKLNLDLRRAAEEIAEQGTRGQRPIIQVEALMGTLDEADKIGRLLNEGVKRGELFVYLELSRAVSKIETEIW